MNRIIAVTKKHPHLKVNYEKNVYPINEHEIGKELKWVYFFYNPTTELFKIGITNDFWRRHKDIQNNCGVFILPLVGALMGDLYDESAEIVEKYLHEYYKHKRKAGEWFKLSLREAFEVYWFLFDFGIDGIHPLEIGENFKDDFRYDIKPPYKYGGPVDYRYKNAKNAVYQIYWQF